MSKEFYFKQFSLRLVGSLTVKAVLFQPIPFNISTQFISIWPIDRTLSGTTTPGQSEPGSHGNDGLLRIPQSSSITEISPSYCLKLYQDIRLAVGVLPLCREAFGVFYSPSRLGNLIDWLVLRAILNHVDSTSIDRWINSYVTHTHTHTYIYIYIYTCICV